MIINPEILKEIDAYPVSHISGNKVEFNGDGFLINNMQEPISADLLYILAQRGMRILTRKSLNKHERHGYDVSDNFDDYYYRIEFSAEEMICTSYDRIMKDGEYTNPATWKEEVIFKVEGLISAEGVLKAIIAICEEDKK